MILLDFEMPEMTGPQVCLELRKIEQFKDTPILFITAQTGEAELKEAFQSGADDYVLKPVRETEIVARIQRSLQTIKLQDELREQAEAQAMLTRVLSHDINNMLTLMQASVIKLSKAVENKDEALNRALWVVKKTASLVKSVRELQSLEDQKFQLVLKPVSLSAVLAECEGVFSDSFREKRVRLVISGESELKVLSDENALMQSVFCNLISNALKFSFP